MTFVVLRASLTAISVQLSILMKAMVAPSAIPVVGMCTKLATNKKPAKKLTLPEVKNFLCYALRCPSLVLLSRQYPSTPSPPKYSDRLTLCHALEQCLLKKESIYRCPCSRVCPDVRKKTRFRRHEFFVAVGAQLAVTVHARPAKMLLLSEVTMTEGSARVAENIEPMRTVYCMDQDALARMSRSLCVFGGKDAQEAKECISVFFVFWSLCMSICVFD